MMTPLPRWVLLAILLALVDAHPVDHACVRLCRVRDTSPVITGVCEHRQKLVLQSSGDEFPLRPLFRFCLTPCHGVGTADYPIFDGSPICRAIRQLLVRLQGCVCDGPSHGHAEYLAKNGEKLENNQWKEINDRDTLRNPDEEKAVVDDNLEHGRGSKTKGTMKVAKVDDEEAESKDAVVLDLNTGSSMEELASTEEDSIDWELWCMTQCDKGRGGSACNCDIIP